MGPLRYGHQKSGGVECKFSGGVNRINVGLGDPTGYDLVFTVKGTFRVLLGVKGGDLSFAFRGLKSAQIRQISSDCHFFGKDRFWQSLASLWFIFSKNESGGSLTSAYRSKSQLSIEKIEVFEDDFWLPECVCLSSHRGVPEKWGRSSRTGY